MTQFSSLIAPFIMAFTALYALYRRVDVFSALTDGARSGLQTVAGMLPPLIALLSAVYMLRASGLTDALTLLLSPLTEKLGIPPDTTALMLLRPFSGSGALSVGSEIMERFGPDSMTGRIAAVMLGSTETTFYVIAVYFGAAGVKKSRRTVPAALAADFVGFLMACLTVRLLFGRG